MVAVQYLLTERAHLMCPNMSFGILFSLGAAYDLGKIEATLRKLSAAHPFLRSVIGDVDGRPYYLALDGLTVPLAQGASAEANVDYLNDLKCGWDVRTECLLRARAYKRADGFDMLFSAHHLLCDGRGLMALAAEFADCYVKGVEPTPARERLITSMGDLPKGSDLPLISKLVIGSANRQWQKERQRVGYDAYRAFEQTYAAEHAPDMRLETVTGEKLNEMTAFCRQNGVTINDCLIADMMRREGTRKVVIAADIRKLLREYAPGSLGNYSTAFSVMSGEKTDDMAALAKDVSKRVRATMQRPQKQMLVLACYLRMTPELIDAAAISTLGGYESKAGLFVGDKLFGFSAGKGYGMTNLGRMESDTILSAAFIPPASPANQKTVGVLTVNGIMKRCEMTA